MILFTNYDDWRRKRGCDGKKRYSRRDAYRASRATWEDKRYRRPYRCAFCGWWHIGRTRGFDDRDPNEWLPPSPGG